MGVICRKLIVLCRCARHQRYFSHLTPPSPDRIIQPREGYYFATTGIPALTAFQTSSQPTNISA